MNVTRARQLLTDLAKFGVQEFCVCAGARNATLVKVISHAENAIVHSFFEERCAAFFALGRIRNTNRPVAVVTTSGTAAAELLPAAIEAYYSRLPLVLVTADRPQSYRKSGAPQAIEQVGLFSHYVLVQQDIAERDSAVVERISFQAPTHINICFEEPLLDEEISSWSLPTTASVSEAPWEEIIDEKFNEFLSTVKSPLVIVGSLPRAQVNDVVSVLEKIDWPIYAEGHSGMRELPQFQSRLFRAGDRYLPLGKVDGIVRIGHVPTLRPWRDLEKSNLPVISFSHTPFSGLARDKSLAAPLRQLSVLLDGHRSADGWAFELARDQKLHAKLINLFAQFPKSEPALISALSRKIPNGARIFIGNSLPIREWDLAATYENKNFWVTGNRGANGIDGLISTFLGFCSERDSNWALLGDLSALYDLAGLWPIQNLATRDINIIVVNNGGGKIFSRVFNNDAAFENRHRLNFAAWAKMFSLDYEVWTEIPEVISRSLHPRIIELIPDNEQSDLFWQNYEKMDQ